MSEEGISNVTLSGVCRKLNVLFDMVENQNEKKIGNIALLAKCEKTNPFSI